jgi:Uma2 family endonuclease
MTAIPQQRRYTFEEFCKLVPDGQKADLIDGAIYMASPDNLESNDLNGWLIVVMRGLAARQDAGRIFFSRVAFRLNAENSPEPDVAFVRKDRLHLLLEGFVDGPPDLAVEIVSPESRDRDYQTKRRLYQKAGVSEYWIIDEEEQKVTLLRLGRDRRYHEARRQKGWLVSRVLPKFRIRPEWLWQDPEPDPVDILARLFPRKLRKRR